MTDFLHPIVWKLFDQGLEIWQKLRPFLNFFEKFLNVKTLANCLIDWFLFFVNFKLLNMYISLCIFSVRLWFLWSGQYKQMPVVIQTYLSFLTKKFNYWDKLLFNIFWGKAFQEKLIDLLHTLHSGKILSWFKSNI